MRELGEVPGIDGRRILVADPDAYAADTICTAIENLGGKVAGPFTSVASVLKFLSHQRVDGAIVEFAFPDGANAPVLERLMEIEAAIVIQTDHEVIDLADRYCDIPVFSKPNPTLRTLRRLVRSLDR